MPEQLDEIDEMWRAKIEEVLDMVWRDVLERMRERCPESSEGLVRGAALAEFLVDATRMLSADGEANAHARMYASAVIARYESVQGEPEVQEASTRLMATVDADPTLRDPVN